MPFADYKNIKVIGFDLDQTLYPKSQEIDEAIKNPLRMAISNLLKVDFSEGKKIFDTLHKDGKGLSGRKTLTEIGFLPEEADQLVQNAVENSDISDFLVPNKKVTDLLIKLKSKYGSIDLITGSRYENAIHKLNKLKISQNIFKKIIAGDTASKSDLTAYKLWMEYHPNYKPENFLYIGDRTSSDYEKPKELGIKSILVNTEEIDPSIECPQLQTIFDVQKYLL